MDKFAPASTISNRQSNHSTLSRMNFTKLSTVNERVALGCRINIVALVVRCDPLTQSRTRSGDTLWMRKVILADTTDCEIELAIWGGQVADRDIPLYCVLAVKDAVVKDFQQKKVLSCLWAHIHINPNIPQAEPFIDLAEWYLAASEAENAVIDGSAEVFNSSECRRDSSLVDNSSAVRETTLEEDSQMGQSSGSLTNASMQSSSDCSATMIRTPLKRPNPFFKDNTDLIKRQKTEQSAHTSTTSCLKPIARVTSVQSTDVTSSRLNFETISTIKERIAVGRTVDIIGLIVKIQGPKKTPTKSGAMKWVWKVILADARNSEIELAIWDGDAENHEIAIHSVVIAKDAQVQIFHGEKTMSCLWTKIQKDPKVPQAARLKDLAEYYPTTWETDKSVVNAPSDDADSSQSLTFETSFTIKERVKVGRKIDVIGLVSKICPPTETQARSGTSKWMRKVILTDDRNCEIELSISDGDVNNLNIPLHCVLTANNAMIREFQGDRKLSCLRTHIQINPKGSQAARLRHFAASNSAVSKKENGVVEGSSGVTTSKRPDQSLKDNADPAKRPKIEQSTKVASSQLNFETISTIKDRIAVGKRIDIIGLVVEVPPPKPTQTTSGIPKSIWKLTLTDDRNSTIEFNIWDVDAENHNIPLHCVLTAENAVVQTFHGNKTLNCLWSQIKIDPEVPQAAGLKEFAPHYVPIQKTQNSVIVSAADFTTIREINSSMAGKHCNVIGFVIKCDEAEQRLVNSGLEKWIRVVTVMDDSGCTIPLTVWCDNVEEHDIPIYSVIIASDATVYLFKDEITLSCGWQKFRINPETQQAVELRRRICELWKENLDPGIGPSNASSASSHFMPIRRIKSAPAAEPSYDIAGFVIDCEPVKKVRRKKDKKLSMTQHLLVADASDAANSVMELTVLGMPSIRSIPLHSVITASNVHIRAAGSDTLRCHMENVQINPPIKEAAELKKLIVQYPSNITIGARHFLDAKSSGDADVSLHDEKSLAGDFTLIEKIKTAPIDSLHDVAGVVVRREPPRDRTTQHGDERWIRELLIADAKDSEIKITVWGNEVIDHDIAIGSVITTNVKVRSMGTEKTLSCYWPRLQILPNIAQSTASKELMAYYSAIFEPTKKGVLRGVCILGHRGKVDFSTIRKIKTEGIAGSGYDIVGGRVINQTSFRPQDIRPFLGREPAEKRLWFTILTITDDKGCEIKVIVWGRERQMMFIPRDTVITAQQATLRGVEKGGEENMLCVTFTNLSVDRHIPRPERLESPIANQSAIETLPDIPNVAGPSSSRTEEEEVVVNPEMDENEPEFPLEFHSISEINTKRGIDTKWDVIGFVREVQAPKEVPSENSWLLKVNLTDSDDNRIDLLIWWETEPKWNEIRFGSVLATINATLEWFEGKLELCTFWDRIAIDPDIPAATRLMEQREAREEDFFVPIEAIQNTPDSINTFGLVVEVSPPEEREASDRGHTEKFIVRKCLLRGRNRAQIELHIIFGSTDPLDIPIQSVIVVRRATLSYNSEKHRILTCNFNCVHLNNIIPEIEGFKEAVLKTSGEPAAEDPNDFTPFEKIMEEIRPGMAINIIGLVVEVFDLTRRRRITKRRAVPDRIRLTLRDLDSRLIVLIIRKNHTMRYLSMIKVGDVIAARGATLKLSDGEEMLWCWRTDVTIDPEVPERYTLLRLKKTISFETVFTPLRDIERKPWLDECTINVIGHVVKVLPVSYRELGYSTAAFIPLVLKNEVEMTVRVDAIGSRTERDIPENAIVIVKKARLSMPNKEYPLRAFWQSLSINPKIPEFLREAKSFGIVPFGKIVETANPGDMMGILAVVCDYPKIFEKSKRNISEETDGSFEEDGDGDTGFKNGDLPGDFVVLVDSSHKLISMRISSASLAKTVKKRSNEAVVIRAMNMEVQRCGGKLMLACTEKTSCIVNQESEEAHELRKWYAHYCSMLRKQHDERCADLEKKLEIPIPIRNVLEDERHNAVASIMGILIKSELRQATGSDVSSLSRLIQVIGDDNKTINLIMHGSLARDFAAPLHSVIWIKMFRVSQVTKGGSKMGIWSPSTKFVVNPSDEGYGIITERLQTWFALKMHDNSNESDIEMGDRSENMEVDAPTLHDDVASAENEQGIVNEEKSTHKQSSPDMFEDC